MSEGEMETDPLLLGQISFKSTELTRGGVSIPWAAVPVSTVCLPPRNMHHLERQQLALRPKEDLIHQSAQRVQPQAPVLSRT